MLLSDFFDQRGTFLTIDQFKLNFGLENFPFTVYRGIINTIPTKWNQSGCGPTEEDNTNAVWMENLLLSDYLSQIAISQFLKNVSNSPTAVCMWAKTFIIYETDIETEFFALWKT